MPGHYKKANKHMEKEEAKRKDVMAGVYKKASNATKKYNNMNRGDMKKGCGGHCK